jgi:hypothetical protein
MALTLPKRSAGQRRPLSDESVAAVVDADEFERAKRDPRVRAFLEEADAHLAQLEREGRSV